MDEGFSETIDVENKTKLHWRQKNVSDRGLKCFSCKE